MTTPIRHLIDQNPLKIEKDIQRNEQTIQLYQEKIQELAQENDKLRLILDPPKNKKRKLRELSQSESTLIHELHQAKKNKKDLQSKHHQSLKPIEDHIRKLEESLQEIDHQNCVTLFDSHDLSDVTDNHYGIVKYQQCSRCLIRIYNN